MDGPATGAGRAAYRSLDMMLRTKVALTSLAIALPAAALILTGIERLRARDMALALERVVTSQINDQVRERCESDPTWFLTGRLEGRPKRNDPPNPNPEALPPRPKVEELPFEFFAYDEEFIGSSSAAPRFPNDLKRALRSETVPAVLPFDTKTGTGVQVAAWTGWIGSPCAIFLGRMRPEPNRTTARVEMFAGLTFVCFAVALLTVTPTVMRIRRLASDENDSAKDQHTSIAPGKSKDEIGLLAFVYNDTAKELHNRRADITDRDDAMRRYVSSTSEDVAAPLVRLATELGAHNSSDSRAFIGVNDLSARVLNLIAAARLRGRGEALSRETMDLGSIVGGAVSRYEPVARVAGVTVNASRPPAPVLVTGDAALFERALSNLLDNAIRYNRPGGHVMLSLTSSSDKGFALKITDDGLGVSSDEFKGLTAIRRFRGDEGRAAQSGVPGLGLAVAREAVERFGLQMELRQPRGGGFEVEISGKTSD
jgi:two-component system, OmpR family, sensor histidine kinase BaeS